MVFELIRIFTAVALTGLALACAAGRHHVLLELLLAGTDRLGRGASAAAKASAKSVRRSGKSVKTEKQAPASGTWLNASGKDVTQPTPAATPEATRPGTPVDESLEWLFAEDPDDE